MDTLKERLLGRVVVLRGGESTVALLMFAYSFLAMMSHNILKPVTRAAFIDQLGSENYPYVLLVAGFLIAGLMHVYSLTLRRLPRRYVVPITQGGIIVVLLLFWALLRTGAWWVTVGLNFLSMFLGIFLISQFWTFANDVYDARQAKRLFGFIGGGAGLGGAFGAAITSVTVEEVGRDNLLLVSAAALIACVGIVHLIIQRQTPAHHVEVDEERGVGAREAIRLLVKSRHLRVLALVVGFAAAGAATIDLQVNMWADASGGDPDTIAAFLARITLYASLAGFLVQVALASRIHRSLGILFALLMLPIGLAASATLILMVGKEWVVAGARALDSTLRYSLDKTTREVLFLPLPADLRYRAKPFIDVTTDRFAKAVTALLLLVLVQPWGLGLSWRQLSYAMLILTSIWIVMALVARREYLDSFRASIGARAIAPDTVRTDVADAATIETLVEELSNPDESAVLYAIEMLEALGKRNLITPLLLQHESPRVRARTLKAIALTRSRVAGGWMSTVERMVQDEDVDVRAAALRALAELAHEDAAVLMRRHLADSEPRVVVTAAIALANSGRPADVDAADEALQQLIADTRDGAAPGRAEVANALAHIDNRRFRPLLVPLLYDRDVRVIQKAIGSARAMGASDGLFVPGLLSLLGHRALKSDARDALVGYGEPIIDALAYALLDQLEQVWIRRHIPATLALLGTQRAMDALVTSLDDPDGFLRYKSIVAIEQLRREHPAIGCPRPVLEALVVKETSRYYNGLTLHQNLLRHTTDAGHSLLASALEDKLRRAVDRIYRILGLLYRVEDVAAARHTIERGEGRRRAAAVEYLDNLLGGTVRKRVMPILDDSPITDKVRYANLVLKSRPRDLEDTLAQLVHEDDPVVAAAAIHFVGQRQLWSLVDDLEYVATHRSRDERVVIEAANWALALKHAGRTSFTVSTDSLPIVELADRVRAVPLFASLSVDELFRIAEAGRETRHPAGRDLCHAGATAEDVLFLLDGKTNTTDESGGSFELGAPAVVGFEEVLQGTTFRSRVTAIDHLLCFRLSAGDFLTMVSDNVLLAQSLFSLLLSANGPRRPAAPSPLTRSLDERANLTPADAARLLRRDPLLARASASQLLALSAASPEVPLRTGAVLFDANSPPAIFLILQGEVILECAAADPVVAAAGTTIGVADTLAGATSGWRATVQREGRALRVDRDDLFVVLADHVDLMQGLFSGAIAFRDTHTVSPVEIPRIEPASLA
jgi:ATP:ADP antiporter, AAA family